MMNNINNTLIPDRSQPGLTITMSTIKNRDVSSKYATGVPKIKKIRGKENISVRTWNVIALRSSVETITADTCNGLVSVEHSGALRDALKTLERCTSIWTWC